jgi:hypothetical protein
MKQDWFSRLYENEIKNLKKKTKELENEIGSEKPCISETRIRDYKIYKACLKTAYTNDLANNREAKITEDEQTILVTLSKMLGLSHEEIKLINYMILGINKLEINNVINSLKNIGVIFYSKKHNSVYIADEVVRVLRKIRGKEIADKYFRRIIKNLREPQINLICKAHNIDWKKDFNKKVKEIINEGISIRDILIDDIYKEDTKVNDKKKFINELWDKSLKISTPIKGITLDEKIDSIIEYFETIESDEKVGISVDGFEKLLIELKETLPKINNSVREEFELQEESVLNSDFLLDFNIKPRDILDILSQEDLEKFCNERNIKTRGNKVVNILENYKDAENLYLENYENIGNRDLNALKENGISIKESELGLKFEDLTKTIFTKLGFNVDEKLKKQINTAKDKIDILITLEDKNVILIECKTVKESGYNKFSSVCRQLKSYIALAKKNGLEIEKVLLVAPDFSDDFITDVELDVELDLSLLTAKSLIKILDGFKDSSYKQLPYKLLKRDVLIKEDRIIKALKK